MFELTLPKRPVNRCILYRNTYRESGQAADYHGFILPNNGVSYHLLAWARNTASGNEPHLRLVAIEESQMSLAERNQFLTDGSLQEAIDKFSKPLIS